LAAGFNWIIRPSALTGRFTLSAQGTNPPQAQLSGVMASNFPGTDHCCCGYCGVGKSCKGAFAPRSALQDSGGYALAGFVGSQLHRESFTRPVESHFHIGNGSFVKFVGNHFQRPPAIILQEFCLETHGLSVR
jgi:hypothetical protein